MFQFTPPVRGATPKLSKAPRQSTSFQFTHPVRGATRTNEIIDKQAEFQFTHPVRGATKVSLSDAVAWRVSIHAPRAGCDRITSWGRHSALSFNSRTPCGVRLLVGAVAAYLLVFQFTHPVRGA